MTSNYLRYFWGGKKPEKRGFVATGDRQESFILQAQKKFGCLLLPTFDLVMRDPPPPG